MEEINLKELLEYFKSRIVTMLVILLIVVVAGSIYSIFLKVPLYRSSSTIVLVSANNNSQSTTQTDVTLNKSLVTTYSEIVKSRSVVEKAINNLNLKYKVSELQSRITVSTVNDSEIIKVEVVDEDKGLAADITNEIINVFSEQIQKIYKLENVSQVDVAEEAGAPYNINIIKDLVIYLLVGIVLAFGLVFVIFYFDTSVKSSEEIENKLGIPVIGVVPKVKRKEK